MHPHLKWLAKHRKCPNCGSDGVEYEGDGKTGLMTFECDRCNWKLREVPYQDVYETSLKSIFVNIVNVTVLNDSGDVTSNFDIAFPRQSNEQ